MAMPSLFQTSDAYLQQMLDRAQALGSRISDFNVGSNARSLYECLAVGLSAQSGVVDQLRLNSYLATAIADALDAKAADQQVTRNPAVAALGSVTISRAAAGAAVTIPAGWSPLQTIPAPGQAPVQVITTADAVFAGSDLSKTVAAVAVTTGVVGNIAANTQLLPLNPVNGFATQGGFAVSGSAFNGGIDAETDDQLRARIPIAVQGRVIGRKAAFLAAALSVPGVVSANVLEAGADRGNGTFVPNGTVEVYWAGASTAGTQVNSQVAAAAMSGQAATAIAATGVPIHFDLQIFDPVGTDNDAMYLAVAGGLAEATATTPVGGTLAYSTAIQVIHNVPQVLSVHIPFNEMKRVGDPGGTAGDIVLKPTEVATLNTTPFTDVLIDVTHI